MKCKYWCWLCLPLIVLCLELWAAFFKSFFMTYCFALVLSNCDCMICPEVTLYGRWNVKILELTNFFFSAFCRILLLFFLLFFSSFFAAAFWGMFCRCGSKWQCDFTDNHKQVVNRLKIPQGLSTSLFHRWSEVPSRGGVHSDSLSEKLPALQRCHLSVFSKCCFLKLLARPSSIRTLLLSGFVVLFSIL